MRILGLLVLLLNPTSDTRYSLPESTERSYSHKAWRGSVTLDRGVLYKSG